MRALPSNWFFPNRCRQAATLFALLGTTASIFHVPDLFFTECANICWKKDQRNACTEAEALAGLSDIAALPLASTSCHALANDAIRVALTEKITAYDACYVTLAQRMSVPLITADQKLVQKLRAVGTRRMARRLDRTTSTP